MLSDRRLQPMRKATSCPKQVQPVHKPSALSTRPAMADLYPPSYPPRAYHRQQDQYPHQPYPMSHHHSGSSNGSADDAHDQPPSPSKSPEQQPQKSETKPQATFLTKLYASVSSFLIPRQKRPIAFDFQASRAFREPPYDSLGSPRRTYRRRAAGAARLTCPPQYLPPVPIRELLPATKCTLSSLNSFSVKTMSRSMALCEK